MAARFLHILLALVTALSSTGLVVNHHICLGEAEEVEMCNAIDSCSSDDDFCCSTKSHDCDDNCCTHHGNYFKLKQDQQTSSLDLQVPAPPQPVAVMVSVPAELLPSNTQLWPAYLSFKPPIVEPDIWLKLETILC